LIAIAKGWKLPSGGLSLLQSAHTEERLTPEEAVQFYGQLQGVVIVGMEACGNTQWFSGFRLGLHNRCMRDCIWVAVGWRWQTSQFRPCDFARA